MYIPVDFMLNV